MKNVTSAGSALFTALLILACSVLPNSASVAQSVSGVFSVSSYGAVCNATTDDTSAFQSAANAASASYSSTGAPVTITYSGNCVIAGSVIYGSGVHWRGYGVITVPNGTASPTFYARNADNVEWDHVDINFVTPYYTSNPFASGIGWFASSDNTGHTHVKVLNCRVVNSSWGISVIYNNGTGSLNDVEIANNTVASASVYTNWDGIHVGGSVSNIRIHDNTVTNRGDAAIALTSEMANGATYVLSGAVIENNIAAENTVGIDISGATNVKVLGNYVRATVATSKPQNPAFRQIVYQGVYPTNIYTSNNYFESGGGGSSFTAKIDPDQGASSWPSLNSTFEKNVVAGPNPFYVRGNSMIIEGNTFTQSGGLFDIDYDGPDGVATSNLVVGTNRWLGNGAVNIGANPSLIQNVKMAPQISSGSMSITNYANVTKVTN